MKKLFYTFAIALGVSIFAITTASADNVAVTANFRDASAVAGGVNTGGLNGDASGTADVGGLVYANGSDVLNLQLTIDDTADTGAIFTAILTIEGVRENPDDLPTPPDGIITATTGGHILMNGSRPDPIAFARNGDEVTFSIGSFVQTSGPAASISFEGYTNVSLDQINNGTAGAKSFTFGDTSFVGPGGGTNATEIIAITGATDVAGEVFDGTGTDRFRWRSVDASFNVTSGSPMILGDFDGDGDVDCDDLDGYVGNIGAAAAAGSALAPLDFDGDGTITQADATSVVSTLVVAGGVAGTFLGDVNCDGMVDVLGDAFPLVANLNGVATSYAQGDVNFSGNVDVLGDAFILVGNLGSTNQ